MQNSTKNVCRCCLRLVHSANVGFINGVMREMLGLLLIKLNLDVSEHLLMCGTCSEVLDEIYLFKSRCLYTEDIISAHIDSNSKVSLRDILIEMENKGNIKVDEDEVVCRLCIKIPMDGSYMALGETADGVSLIRDTMQVYLPEIDLSIDEKPIICEVCQVQLKNYASFATNCMAVEEKIKLYCDIKEISGPVNLARVLPFTEHKALDLQNSLDEDLVVKQEDDSVRVKVETVQDAEDLIVEDRLVDSSRVIELYLKNEEIEIKSENDEISKQMEDSVATVAANSSGKSGSLKRKMKIRKSPSKGRQNLSSDDHHMVRHVGCNKTFGCLECTFKTDRKYILARHMARHKGKSEVMRKCANCEYITRSKSNMKRHIMERHRDPRAERRFKCNQCPYETNFKCYLRKHNLIHKEKLEVEMYKCANCEYESKYKSNMIQHMVKHRDPGAERKFKCDKCPYEANFKASLRKHILIHKDKSEVELYKCKSCEFETKWKGYLTTHMVKHRDPKAERKFKCDQCTYETDIKSYLRKHTLRYHGKLKIHQKTEMHKCANCEFETRHKSGLYQHMIVHRDPRVERKFKCDQCPFETDYKSCIHQHNLTHRDKSEVEMYKCANCAFETKQKRYLIPHMAKHRDPRVERKFKCDKCPYKTDHRYLLRMHNLIHRDKSEVEMRKCAICEYVTRDQRYMSKHMVKKDGDPVEMHRCNSCVFETRHKGHMIRHMLKHRDPKAKRKLS